MPTAAIEPARAVDADPHQHVLAARVGLDGEAAVFDALWTRSAIAVDHDEGHALLAELVGDDAADAAVAADDEVILDLVAACD